MKNFALFIAGILFLAIALIHLYRLIQPFNLVIGDYSVPLWVNVIGFFVAGLLCVWMFYALTD